MRTDSIFDDCTIRDKKPMRRMTTPAGSLRCIVLMCLFWSVPFRGQESGQNITGRPITLESARQEASGKAVDNYLVQQSVEVGGRITEVTGSSEMFDTLLNMQSGPRVLQQMLIMHPLSRHALFDNLYLDSFGWGGDPSNAARLRVSKRGVYDFNASFRRDKNYFNDNLLANPLNTAPAPQIDFSPHAMFLTRRMYDFDLVVAPQRTFSFRIGFSRQRNEGPSLSSDHQTVDALIYQNFSTTSDSYRMGASWRIVPKTTLSFDESLQFLKNDTDQSLAPTPNPFLNPPILAPSGANFFSDYSRSMSYRIYVPTERVSLASNSIHNLSITARYLYSSANADTPLSEIFDGNHDGFIASNTNGSLAHVTWVTDEADLGITYRFNSRLRLVDSFRFYAYRIPGVLNLLGTASTASSSTPVNIFYTRFSQQSIKSNDFSLLYDVTRHLGVRVGYVYRNIFDGHRWLTCPGLVGTPDPFSQCTVAVARDSQDEPVTINRHTAVVGVWYRISESLRADAEYRIMSADNYLVRIDPRREQRFRANLTIAPVRWLTARANLNMREDRNHTQDFDYNAHVRNFGFSLSASPKRWFSANVAYDYMNTTQNSNICYSSSIVAPGSFPAGCVNDPTVEEVFGVYSNRTHSGNVSLLFKPIARLSFSAGYSVIKVDGNELILYPQQPLGPLSARYDQPSALVVYQIARKIGLHAGWNYYQYNDDNSLLGGGSAPTSPRYFHANITTLSMVYSF